MQEIVEQFREQVRAATAARTPLRLRGGGTKDWYGEALQGALLDTRRHAGVVDYEPTELVITVRCGTPLAEVEDLLARHRQMLAFEPPRFGAGSTIGGVVAAGLSGPRRASAGAVRDFVLGAELMDGRGELLRFGGQVMKNVAGYDVSRVLAGSLGTLGLITEVSLKVLPLPVREETIRFEMDEITALARVNAWGGQPLPVSATCWRGGVLTVRLSGADAAIRAALQKLGGELVASTEADAFWTALRDQTHAFFGASGAAEEGSMVDDLWRLSVPSTASAIILRGEQLIEWGGSQRWLRVPAADATDATDVASALNTGSAGSTTSAAASADAIRRTVAAVGGHATLYRRAAANSAAQAADAASAAARMAGADAAKAGDSARIDAGEQTTAPRVFHPLAPATARIHERLKAGFDPSGIFNPGRMY